MIANYRKTEFESNLVVFSLEPRSMKYDVMPRINGTQLNLSDHQNAKPGLGVRLREAVVTYERSDHLRS